MRVSVFFDHILQAQQQTGKSMPELLAGVRNAGIEAVEINLQYLLEHKEVVSLLHQADLAISCIYEFYEMEKQDEKKHVRQHIETVVQVGAKKILVVPGFLSEKESTQMQEALNDYDKTITFMDANKSVQHMVDEMKFAVLCGTQHNIIVTVEDFDDWKSPVSRVNGIAYLLERVSGLKYTLDMGNFAYSDENVLEAWELLKDKVAHVHCKDRGEEPEQQGRINNKGLRTVAVGDGYIPVKELVGKLKAKGYDDYFAIEHFDAPEQDQYIRRSAQFLKTL